MSEQEYLTVQVHKEFAERIDAEEKRQNKRLDKLEDGFGQLSELTSALKVMANNMANMAKEQGKIGERLEVIENKPSQNWDKLMWTIAGALIAGIIGYLIASMGIG